MTTQSASRDELCSYRTWHQDSETALTGRRARPLKGSVSGNHINPAGSMSIFQPSKQPAVALMTSDSSSRAKAAPRQLWIPCPKLKTQGP
jgi:hypothetical protein